MTAVVITAIQGNSE